MSLRITVALMVVALLGYPARAIQVPEGLDTCSTLQSCLSLLDKVVPAQDDGSESNSEILAHDLRRFGEPAKQELLRRASGPHPGWRNLAGSILMEWHSWDPADVPALAAALRKQPGGWVARCLGEIGTPDAIQALIADLVGLSDDENQTGFALEQLGSKSVPALFPLFKTEVGAHPASAVLGRISPAALPFAAGWVALALNSHQPIRDRLAALRALAALGSPAKSAGAQLHTLLHETHPEIAMQTRLTLIAIRDPILLRDVAAQCRPKAAPFAPYAIDALVCLRDLASYGDDLRSAGDILVPFLSSQNAEERAYGSIVLGAYGYAPAIPLLRQLTGDPDWRVVNASVRALGWLGAQDAVPNLDRIAGTHWLPEIRQQAQSAAAAIRSSAGRVIPPKPEDFIVPSDVPFEQHPMNMDGWLNEAPTCPSNTWQWQNQTFRLADEDHKLRDSVERNGVELKFSDGKLTGTNRGEWGGTLTWHPRHGNPTKLHGDNVIAILPDGSNAVVIYGLDYVEPTGYALLFTRTDSGDWQPKILARLLSAPRDVTTLGPGLYAALNRNRAIVFSASQGILGLASCKP